VSSMMRIFGGMEATLSPGRLACQAPARALKYFLWNGTPEGLG